MHWVDWLWLGVLVFCFLLTLLIFACHKNIDPLGDRTARASEGFILVLMLMGLRWFLLFLVILVMPVSWTWRIVGIAAHLGLGILNMNIWNRWVSVIYDKTRLQLQLYCWTFLFLPIAVIIALALIRFA